MAERGAQPGNKNASKNKIWHEAIRRVVTQENGKLLRATAERLVTEAANGDVAALRELGDRLDGKAVQAISGDLDLNLTVEVVRFADKTA